MTVEQEQAAEDAEHILRGEGCRTCRFCAFEAIGGGAKYVMRCAQAELRLGHLKPRTKPHPRCPERLWCELWEVQR